MGWTRCDLDRPGERAAREGECPEGEECSPEILGLYFSGAGVFEGEHQLDGAILPIAEHGRQRFSARTEDETPLRDAVWSSERNDVLYGDNPFVARNPGGSLVSVRDEDGLLLDRFSASVCRVSSIVPAPIHVERGFIGGPYVVDVSAWDEFAFTPGVREVGLRLRCGSRRAVDTGLVMASDAIRRRSRWDAAFIDIPPEGTTIPLFFTDGFAASVEVPVAGPPDDVRIGVGAPLPEVAIVGAFVGTDVTLYSEGRIIVDPPMPEIVLSQGEAELQVSERPPVAHHVWLQLLAPGTVRVTVRVGGLIATTSIEVREADDSSS